MAHEEETEERYRQTVDEDRPRGRQTVVTSNSLMPLGLVLAVLGAAVIGDRRLGAIENSQADSSKTLVKIATSLDRKWDLQNMRAWTQQLKIQNPDIQVPDPITFDNPRN